jgi:diguanylate cyclase (GGDEF)-like protein
VPGVGIREVAGREVGAPYASSARATLVHGLGVSRVVLSLVLVVLLLAAPSDSIALPGGVTGVLVLFSAAYALISAVNLLSGRQASLGRGASGLQLAGDVVIALLAVLLLDPVAAPLAWTALLLPVLDAATVFGGGAAAGIWVAVGLAYAGLRFRVVPGGAMDGDTVRLIVQQLAAVAVFALPMAFLAGRLRDDFDHARQTLAAAERRAGDLALVAAAAKELDATTDPTYILELAVRFTRALGFEHVEILEHAEEHGWRLRTASGRGVPQVPHRAERLDAAAGGSVVTSGLAATAGVQRDLDRLGFGTEVVAPLWRGEKSAGVLRALSVEAMTDVESPVEAVKLLASQVVGAWRNATALEALTVWSRQLEHDATHDHLTGLPNRAHLLTTIESRLLALRRSGGGFAVLFLDLDGFKEINDGMGHEAGDLLLQAVAGRLRHAIRPGDLVARLAGDEFVLVADCPPSQQAAAAIAGRISACLCEPFTVGGALVTVRASVGVAHAASADTVDRILRSADHAMYDAKRLGRGFAIAGSAEGANLQRSA